MVLVFVPRINAQKKNLGLSITPEFGYLLAHRITMGHLIKEHAYAVNLNSVIYTNGKKKWHHDFLYPEFNFGITYASLGNNEILGKAFGLGGGIYLPFFRKNQWSLGTHLNAVLAVVTKPYDVETNPKNNAIGSYVNGLFKIGLRVEKRINQHAFGLNIGITHLSNGAIRLPNLGLNFPLLGLHYTYYFAPVNTLETPTDERVGQPLKSWQFFTQIIGSSNQIYPTGGNNYGVVAVSNYFHYKIERKFTVEGGIDVSYSQSLIKQVEGEWDRAKNLRVGIYAGYVLPIHRFEFYVGMGGYAYDRLNANGRWFHKFGTRFQIYDFIWANISIKSHWFKADYFEYGLSFRW